MIWNGQVKSMRQAAAVCAFVVLSGSLRADQVRTNWVERWITNQIEVTVPANHVVTEYHTNVLVKTQTNVVTVFATNTLTRTLTNQVWVDKFRTNFVVAYQTNFIPAYQTNYKTLHVTNWATVLVLKTNWVQQAVTNVAQVDMARTEVAPPPKAAVPEKSAPAVPSSPGSDALVLEASHGNKLAPVNQADVRLKAHWANRTDNEILVQQWKVQSQEGSVLAFGQEAEFHRNLPFGKYKVELKARFDSHSPVVTVRGVLAVTGRDVSIDQNSLASR